MIVYIVPAMLTEVLYPLQYGRTALILSPGDTPLLIAARGGYATCVEHLLSTPGFDVDNAFKTIYY